MKYPNIDIDIEDIQKIQTELLIEFDQICKRNDIKYQLFAGTLLGSIRHQGFIPWDDDIDVILLRKDYERFLDICKKELKPAYFLQTYKTDKNSILQFAKIRKNNTVFLSKRFVGCNVHHGIYIDIFPMDNVKPDEIIGKIQLYLSIMLFKINRLRLPSRYKMEKNPLTKSIKYAVHILLKIISKSFTDKLQTKICRMFEDNDTKFVTHLTNNPNRSRYHKYLMKKDCFYDIIDGNFEGEKFLIPKDYDQILRKLFGDYMEMPPEAERMPHHSIMKIEL